jgi:hypothetical protein
VPVSREEERAKILRAIARGGFSPYAEDSDGNTAEHLENWARELDAPSDHQTWMASAARGFAAIGRAMRSRRRRWYHRMALRVKLRWLGLVPVVAMGWCSLEVRALVAQQPPHDSLYAMPWVREQIGEWSGQGRVWCITRWSDFGSLFLVVSIARPDTTTHCGALPLLVDLPECPRGDLTPVAAPFMIARCGNDGWQRFPARQKMPRTI